MNIGNVRFLRTFLFCCHLIRKLPLAVFDIICYNKMNYADDTTVSLRFCRQAVIPLIRM